MKLSCLRPVGPDQENRNDKHCNETNAPTQIQTLFQAYRVDTADGVGYLCLGASAFVACNEFFDRR